MIWIRFWIWIRNLSRNLNLFEVGTGIAINHYPELFHNTVSYILYIEKIEALFVASRLNKGL
jgi:hypothetical protein